LGIRRKCLRRGWSRSLYQFIKRVIKKIDCSNYRGISLCQLHTKFIQHPAVKVNSICRGNYWGSWTWILMQWVNYWSYILHSSNTWVIWEYNETVHLLFIDLKKGYYWVRRVVFYYILIKFGITMKLIRLIKMCVSETYSRVQVGKQFSDMFCIKNSLRQGGTLLPLLVNVS
jgi:hypothetical protein